MPVRNPHQLQLRFGRQLRVAWHGWPAARFRWPVQRLVAGRPDRALAQDIPFTGNDVDQSLSHRGLRNQHELRVPFGAQGDGGVGIILRASALESDGAVGSVATIDINDRPRDVRRC
jgi:hypothetical protein